MKKAQMLAAAAAIAALSAVAAGPSRAADDYGPMKEMKTSMGTVLADARGMTLYTYDKDTPGKSNCSGKCAKFWPPAMASAKDKPTGGLTIIKRADGSRQWADDGKPLYTYISDTKPGQVTGDGKGGVWHIVKEN